MLLLQLPQTSLLTEVHRVLRLPLSKKHSNFTGGSGFGSGWPPNSTDQGSGHCRLRCAQDPEVCGVLHRLHSVLDMLQHPSLLRKGQAADIHNYHHPRELLRDVAQAVVHQPTSGGCSPSPLPQGWHKGGSCNEEVSNWDPLSPQSYTKLLLAFLSLVSPDSICSSYLH